MRTLHNIAISILSFTYPMLFSSLPPPPHGLFFLSVTSQSILILLSFLSLFQATQLTHVVEGRLNGMMEEADKEKALKQVVEANLKEKTLELNVVERRAATTEKVRELV